MPVWKAIAEVAPLSPTALDGAAGAFVFTAAYGADLGAFEKSIAEALADLQLSLTALDEVATMDEHVEHLDEEAASFWLAVAEEVEHAGEPYFGDFHTYPSAN